MGAMFLSSSYVSNNREQFYKIIRPISLLLKFIGFFPFQNAGSNNGMHLSYDCSTGYIHLKITLMVYTIPSVYIILNARNNFDMFSEIILVAILVALIINCFTTDAILLDIIHEIEEYDEFYIHSRYSVISKRYKFRGFFVFAICIIIFKANFLEYIINHKLVDSDLVEFVWIYLIQSAPWLTMIGGFYVQLCWEISLRFSELRQIIAGNLFASKIEDARLMHGKLKDINDKLNSCFGFRISLFSLYFLHSFLNLFYKNVVANKRVTLFIFAAEVKLFLILYIICYSSEFTSNENKDLVRELQAKPKIEVDLASAFQLELLIEEAESSAFTISAWGLFKVDREMYATMFVVVVTYVITVLQIPPEYNQYLLRERK